MLWHRTSLGWADVTETGEIISSRAGLEPAGYTVCINMFLLLNLVGASCIQ